MFRLLGGMIGVYLVYALFAAIFKHKSGLIIAAVLNLLTGISFAVIQADYFSLLSAIGAIPVIYLVPNIQIRNSNLQSKMNNNKGLSKAFFWIAAILSFNGPKTGVSGGIFYVLLYYSIPLILIVLGLVFDKKSRK